MKTLLSILLLALIAGDAYGVPLAVSRRDAKFPTQQMVEKQSFDNVLASNISTVKASGYDGPTSAAAVTLTSFDDSTPDVPRALSITPGGTTGDIEACVVVVSGTDIFNNSISETFTFAANATGKITGFKAFKTVSSVVWPANCESGGFAATWSIGVEEELGLKRCIGNAGDFFFSLLNGSKEATAPTLHSSANSSVASNTVNFNGTYDGSADFILYFMQNYLCFP